MCIRDRGLHVAAVSFVGSLGQVGAAVLPFAIGAAVQGMGIGGFMYVVVVLLGICVGLWVVFARVKGVKVKAVRGEDDGDECGGGR